MDKKSVLCLCKGLLIMDLFASVWFEKMIESVSKSEVEFIDYRFGVDITNRLKNRSLKLKT